MADYGFNTVFAGTELVGVIATSQVYDASLVLAPLVLSYDHTGESEFSASCAPMTLSAVASITDSVGTSVILMKGAKLTASVITGTANSATISRKISMAATVRTGNRYNAVMMAAPVRLTANVTSRGQFYFAAMMAPMTLSAVAAITPPPSLASDSSVIAPITAWVVNLATGGHGLYTGALDGSEPVNAKAVTGSTDFGATTETHLFDIYAHIRTNGAVRIDLLTDEQKSVAGDPITYDGREGMHRRRSKHPKGVKGNNWQATFVNLDGADFTMKAMEAYPVVAQRISRR